MKSKTIILRKTVIFTSRLQGYFCTWRDAPETTRPCCVARNLLSVLMRQNRRDRGSGPFPPNSGCPFRPHARRCTYTPTGSEWGYEARKRRYGPTRTAGRTLIECPRSCRAQSTSLWYPFDDPAPSFGTFPAPSTICSWGSPILFIF